MNSLLSGGWLGCQLIHCYFSFSYDEFLREYAIQMPYGYLIGAYFTAMLLESCDFLNTFERLPSLIWTLGGDVADRETQAQILEMYELHKKFNLKLLDDA